MKLAPQPVRRDLRAKPAPPNLSICAQCACIHPAISTSRTLAKNCRAVSVSLSRFFRYRSSDAKRNASKPFRMNTCESVAKQRRSEEHTSELQSRVDLVCRLLLEK